MTEAQSVSNHAKISKRTLERLRTGLKKYKKIVQELRERDVCMRVLCIAALVTVFSLGCSQPTISQVEKARPVSENSEVGETLESKGSVAAKTEVTESPLVTETLAPKRDSVIHVTEAAAEVFKSYLNNPGSYVRLSTIGDGCNGFRYHLDIEESPYNNNDVVDNSNGFTFVLNTKAVLFARGTTIDWVVRDGKEGFVFDNPNAVKKE